MKRIKTLSIDLINKIAAGEVIERPASVVKELVENAIDAGSSKIEITISNDCRNIRIADNGSGIHPDDIDNAFLKNATSKIFSESDLWNISTLGFRGEALASIISVAKVTCTSRTKDFDFGMRVEAENSIIKKSKTGCAEGTVLEVENLFASQPARLKFLKSDKTEFSYIKESVIQTALSHQETGFTLIHNGEKIISTNPESDLISRIEDLFGNSVIQELREINKHDTFAGMSLSGYTTVPSFTRSDKKGIRVFVNSRPLRCPILLKAIDNAYRNLLPSGKYPFTVLNLEIPPSDVDVNAHPTKREIRYKNPNQVFAFVISGIDKALSSRNYQTASVEHENVIPFDFAPKEYSDAENDTYYLSDTKTPQCSFLHSHPSEHCLQKSLFTSDNKEVNNSIEPSDKIIGQFKDTYILIETQSGLEIVDQHIADERYLYEKLKNQNNQIASQLLLVSDTVELEEHSVELLIAASPKLNKAGWQIDVLSPTSVVLKRVPQLLSGIKPAELIHELVENIEGAKEQLEEKILITVACKAAVKAGEKLSLWQAEELIKRWRATKNPEVCPHGRPISKIIPTSQIAAFFDRHMT